MKIDVELTGRNRVTVTLHKTKMGLIEQKFEWEGSLWDPVAKQVFALAKVIEITGTRVEEAS